MAHGLPGRACPLKDMEFIQFHPTGLSPRNILMTEGCPRRGRLPRQRPGRALHGELRAQVHGAGAARHHRPLHQTEINEGRGIDGLPYVHLDLRHLGAEKILERLPGIRDLAIHFEGVDPIEAPIPIVPSQHYTMGGIDYRRRRAHHLPGLYAAGECACVSVHGANRLGGNSLLETIVFGRRAGRPRWSVPGGRGGQRSRTPARRRRGAGHGGRGRPIWPRAPPPRTTYALRTEMVATTRDHFGVFRDEPTMKAGSRSCVAVKARCKHDRPAQRGRRLQPRHDPHARPGGHDRRGPGDGGGRRGRAPNHAGRTSAPTTTSETTSTGSSTRWPTTGPMRPVPGSSYKPVTLGTFEPQERKY